MPKQEINQHDIAETFSKTLFNHGMVKRGVLPKQNRWGIDVLYHKRESGKMMFHWVTKDMLEINLEFDLMELNKQGKVYIDSRFEMIGMQLKAARKERQENESIIIHNSSPAPEKKPLAESISNATAPVAAGNQTVH